jgi:hypothetical protein
MDRTWYFVDDGLNKKGCAQRLNDLHGQFSKSLGFDTLAQLARAQELGAQLISVKGGFHARNNLVGTLCRSLLAFSFAPAAVGKKSTPSKSRRGKPAATCSAPTDGGTKYTWNKCPLAAHLKLHVNLCDFA